MTASIQSKGGKASAKKLAPKERRVIASTAAKARWGEFYSVPSVDFPGTLKLGNVSIPCAVLTDGTRVLSETGITKAILGVRSGASASNGCCTKQAPIEKAAMKGAPLIV
jgi:hypothetical protein